MASRIEEEAPATAAEDQTPEKSWQKSDREFLMVMVTFIGTISFQAGTNPPGGVWQDDTNPRFEAGKSIMASKHPSQFVGYIVGVTTSMLFSAVQLMVLMNELPYNKLADSRNFIYASLGITLSGMGIAYWTSVTALTPSSMVREIRAALLAEIVIAAVALAITIICCSRLKCNN